MSEFTDPVTVCNEKDIEENEMKQLDFLGDTKILLIKQNGKLSAIGNKCTHYGAPLHTGALGQGRVRCPWHGACFNIETGDIEDFPGLDSLPCYSVEVENGQVKVRAKRQDVDSKKRIKIMAKRTEQDQRTFVVIGGGPGGAVCAETLRQEGFTGRIVMLCRERNLPYDRVKVSKTLDTQIEAIQLRSASFYQEHGIETLLGVYATKVDSATKTVECSDGDKIKFDKLFVATGSSPLKPAIKGVELVNVATLRDITDANSIASHVNAETHAICLGTSFIALETAAYMASKAKSVTLVGRTKVPLQVAFGAEVGGRILQLFEQHNVKMIMNSGIKEILGNSNNEVAEVVLVDGTKLPCDLLVLGTGTGYNTEFMRDSGVAVNDNGSIDTDMHLRTNIVDIYVGGDIANAPVYSIANERATIGHYQIAQYHGRIAAQNMVGKIKQLRTVPFFFTMLFGKGFRYSGYGPYRNVFIDGDLENFKFAAYYLDEHSNVVAVASCGRDPIVAQFAELQSQGKRLHLSDIQEAADTSAWTNMLKLQPCVS